MSETSNRDNGDQRLNEEEARIAAGGEKDWRDIGRQPGVSPEDPVAPKGCTDHLRSHLASQLFGAVCTGTCAWGAANRLDAKI